MQRERGLGAEELVAGGVADQDRCGQRPAALLGQKLRSAREDELGELVLQRVDPSIELAQVGELLACYSIACSGCWLRRRRSTRSSVFGWLSALRLSDASSSGQSARRCQRTRFTVRVRSATRSER